MPYRSSPVPALELPSDDLEAMEQFAAELGIGEDVDLLLVGDGSGGTFRSSAGWGCMAYDRDLEMVAIYVGANTAGTVNAELLPHVHALWHHREHRQLDTVSEATCAIVILVSLMSDEHFTVGDRVRRRTS